MDEPRDRISRLTRALYISGTINILLFTFLCYWIWRDQPPAPYFENKPASKTESQKPLALSQTNGQMLRKMRQMSLDDLIQKLNSQELVDNGYMQRDLALATLVAIHQLDLEKALQGISKPEQQRTLVYGKFKDGSNAEIVVYPSLSDAHFKAIIAFATTEKWPLTTQGLFNQLKTREPSLLDTFYLSSEFRSVELLLNRSGKQIERDEIVNLLTEGKWKSLSDFAEKQKAIQDLSEARRQQFLVGYIDEGSATAAYILLKTDPEFAQRKLDDKRVLVLLKLLSVNTPEAKSYALAQLASPRSDAVLRHAAKRLYEYSGEVPPEKFNHRLALERFLPKSAALPLVIQPVPVKTVQPTKPKVVSPKPTVTTAKSKTYRVREGDTLVVISRRFKVDVEALRKKNKLTTDNLKPGTTIQIP